MTPSAVRSNLTGTSSRAAIISKPGVAAAVSFVIALLALAGAIRLWGADRPLDKGDPEQYLAIGSSLASGHGYKDTVGPWPERIAYDRMPGWPFAIAVALKAAPWASPDAAARIAGISCLALAALFFTLFECRLGINPGLAILGGLAVALSPGMVALTMAGFSENVFLVLLAGSIAAFLAGGRWYYAAALLIGLTPLVRTNFLLIPFLLILLLLIFPTARRPLMRIGWARIAVLLCIAVLPCLLWAIRNYPLTGRFPVLSSLEGEALWGANNPVVANTLDAWGYWIIPDEVPGETPKLVLAKTRTDMELSDYYHAEGMKWIKSNLPGLPRLILGKFVRGFVPVAWRPVAGTWVVFTYRFLLDVLLLAFVRWWWPAMNRFYLLLCFAVLLVNLATVVLYYGSSRFIHSTVEVLFVPCILLGFQNWLAARSGRRAVSA